MYSSGGCIARAGSCKMGLKPNPLVCITGILSKGFDVRRVNNINPIVINACVSKAFETKLKFDRLYNLKIK